MFPVFPIPDERPKSRSWFKNNLALGRKSSARCRLFELIRIRHWEEWNGIVLGISLAAISEVTDQRISRITNDDIMTQKSETIVLLRACFAQQPFIMSFDHVTGAMYGGFFGVVWSGFVATHVLEKTKIEALELVDDELLDFLPKRRTPADCTSLGVSKALFPSMPDLLPPGRIQVRQSMVKVEADPDFKGATSQLIRPHGLIQTTSEEPGPEEAGIRASYNVTTASQSVTLGSMGPFATSSIQLSIVGPTLAINKRVWEQKNITSAVAMKGNEKQVTKWCEEREELLRKKTKGSTSGSLQVERETAKTWKTHVVEINVDASVVINYLSFFVGMVRHDHEGFQDFVRSRYDILCHQALGLLLVLQRAVKMYTSKKKISKDNGLEPTEFEESVAQALFDLENTNQDLKSDLKDLYINSAAQIDIANRKAVVIHVPYRLRKAFRKIHLKLVRELEKKFSGKDVVVIVTRRILRPPKKGSAAQRPRSRTLTAVHEAMLEDVVHPAEIVGKRIRYRFDGSKIIKIYLDPKARNDTEYKLETFAGVYRKLSGKDVVFEYPITEA
ncbi:hypothetical protein AgCh_033847 [Apium graveolens]